MTTFKTYPHITGVFGDGGENEGAMAVQAQLYPGPNLPDCVRIIVGSPSKTPTIPGYIPDLGGFSCGPDAADRLIATLQEAVRDVRAAIGGAQPSAPGALIPALWFDREGSGPSNLALQLHPFAAEMGGRIPATLGIRIRANHAGAGITLVYGAAEGMLDGGFNLGREQVEQLHREFGAWLAANAAPGPVAA